MRWIEPEPSGKSSDPRHVIADRVPISTGMAANERRGASLSDLPRMGKGLAVPLS